MNVTATQQSYTSYQTQSGNSTSKTESTSGDFLSAMQEVESNRNEIEENKEVDLLDVQAFKNMSLEERNELKEKLKDKFGDEKAFLMGISLFAASQFENKDMQNNMFNKLSNMSLGDAINYQSDLNQNLKRFKAGKELNPNYSMLGIDNNGELIFNYNDNTANSTQNLSSSEFKDFLLSMAQTHHSKQSVVGQQAKDYAKFYEDILDLYTKNYSDKENSYQPYA
ncbi:MAG: hypothetical protein ACNI25_03425 [Halarcobacter sp.]